MGVPGPGTIGQNGPRDQGSLHLGPGPLPELQLEPGTKASRYRIWTMDQPLKFEWDQGPSRKNGLDQGPSISPIQSLHDFNSMSNLF